MKLLKIFLPGCLLVAGLVLVGRTGVVPVQAQGGDVTWSPAILLSNPEVDAWAPTIATDAFGFVHLMWSETVSSNPPVGEGDTIFYKRLDTRTGEWSDTVDVLVSPRDASAAPELAVTPDGFLHAVWQNGGGSAQLLYSRAPVCCADNPWNWSEPKKLGGPVLATIGFVSDRWGRLHIAYADEVEKNIIYRRSDDGGDTWPVWREIDGGLRLEDEYTVYPRLAVDDRGRVHIVWTVLPWPGRRIMYVRSDDGGDTWLTPKELDSPIREDYRGGEQDYGPMFVDIEAQGEDTLHVIWDGAPTVERNYIRSVDGGKTWSRPLIIFPQVTQVGRSGWNDMAVDSAGRVHAVSLQPNDPPLHSMFNGANWSPPDQLPTADIVELLRIAVTGGSTLHVVWTVKTAQPFTVWYMQGKTTAPAVPFQPVPAPPPAASSNPAASQAEGTAEPGTGLSPRAADISHDYRPVERMTPGNLVLLGVVPALLALVIIFAVRITQIRWPKEY